MPDHRKWVRVNRRDPYKRLRHARKVVEQAVRAGRKEFQGVPIPDLETINMPEFLRTACEIAEEATAANGSASDHSA
jgi:hypothetical protein